MRPIRAQLRTGWKQMADARGITTRWIATGDGRPQMDHGRRMTINLLLFYEDVQAMPSYTILEIMTLKSNYKVSMERRYACIRCTGGMAPPSTIPSTLQSTIQRYGIMQLHARVPIPNTIPSHTATMLIPHIMKPYDISLWRSNDL